MASGNRFGGRKERPYRKRRPLPALIIIVILGIGAIFIWVNAVASKDDVNDAVRCQPGPSPEPGVTFTRLGHDALDEAVPIPPDKVALTVLNAGSTRGQATITTESLRQLGFSQIGPPGNDSAYQGREAKCRGQLRFGTNGAAAARTLSLITPCVELVRDTRQDATIDLAIGSAFGDLRPKQEGLDALEQLRTWSEQHNSAGGGEQATGEQAPKLDEELVAAARETTC